MSRVKRGTTVRRRHNKLLSLTKGYKHGRNNLVKQAHQAVLKAGVFAYRDRKVKKRTFRAHWITVLSAAAKQNGMNYSTFMQGLTKANITLNRRVLNEMAKSHPAEFQAIIDKVKATA